MEKYKMLGCAIRQAREEKGWTRHELADRIGTDTESVSRLEDGWTIFPCQKPRDIFAC